MKLVVSYTVSDGCTYSCQCDVPVEYESAEHLLVHIENEVAGHLDRDAKRAAALTTLIEVTYEPLGSGEHSTFLERFPRLSHELKVTGTPLYVSHFIEDGKFQPPTIYTVDEWFEAGARGDLS